MPTPTPTFTAQGSMFEGLYVKVLKPTGAFRDDLAKAGFDLHALRPEYPMDVWVACLDVTAKHLHPTLKRFAAWRLIGRDFITGFLDTIVGRLVAVALPFLSPKTFIDRSPRFLRMGVKELQAVVEWKGPRQAVVTLDGPHDGSGHLLAGVVEVCLERLQVTPTVTPSSLGGTASRLVITW
jgi:uncharacterized protein (TIGR02265 family)